MTQAARTGDRLGQHGVACLPQHGLARLTPQGCTRNAHTNSPRRYHATLLGALTGANTVPPLGLERRLDGF